MIIYSVINKINNKPYIGQTTRTLEKRKHEEVKQPKQRLLYNAIKKYGIDSFIWEEIDQSDTLEELNELEVFYIQFYDSLTPNGYNLTTGGDNRLHSEETKIKMYITNIRVISDEGKKRISEFNTGRKQSEETKKKRSETLLTPNRLLSKSGKYKRKKKIENGFVNNPRYQLRKDTNTLQLTYHNKIKHFRWGTGIKCLPENWDEVNQQMIPKDQFNVENKLLFELLNKLKNIIINYRIETGKNPSSDIVKQKMIL